MRSLECTWELGATPSSRRSPTFLRRGLVIWPRWDLLDTGLARSSREAADWARVQEEKMVERIRLRLTDYDFTGQWDRTLDAFARMADALCDALGEPTVRKPGSPAEIHWAAGDETTLLLEHAGSCVYLELVTDKRLSLDEELRQLTEDEEEGRL
ncbi:DUF6301 family protein [Streptomyces sp. NBC_00237]|uniref:DUF6301 family protein n=1 Tax=Streptomyces sp. NBC_00237 TaxID=2975687 RepID=UPI0022584515|nr:DUF6301 family protein [Streptomyces sp. NBC_00237]MCX5206228.1 DUF6301 family protein [Streptomyces sp. NBC_00237]